MIKNPKKSKDDIQEETAEKAEEIIQETAEETPCSPDSECEAEASASEETKEEKAKDKSAKELAALNDKYLRLMAEYDNFKKRTVKEKEAIYIDSVGDTVSALLPVVDNLERALASFSDSDKESEFFKGFEMIYNQTIEAFSKLGVTVIEAVGAEFNPELHNAVMHIDDETLGENVIVEEFQKGYTYRDKVIRYSMVKVAN